ncbi:MAG: CPBP family intramembrane metalloprotease [Clostridiales bacterium]|nr:CPBP family intramembrane metalloprotease [Clostridiales bacterium]
MKNVTKANVIFTSIILVYMIMFFSLRLFNGMGMSYNLLLVVPEIVLAISAIVATLLIKSNAIKDAGYGMVSIGTLLKSFILAFLCLPLIMVINALSSMINGNAVSSSMDVITRNPMWLSLILVALVPALVEEFIFRGILFGTYKKRNPMRAVFLSAFLFGLMHMNINQFAYAFVIGIILALLAYATGSIWAGVIVHFTINASSIVLSYLTGSLSANEGTQLQSSTSAEVASATTNIDSTTAAIIGILAIIVIVASATALAVSLFINIANKNRGMKSVVNIFRRPIRCNYADEGKFFDGFLILGITICVCFITYFDIINGLLVRLG